MNEKHKVINNLNPSPATAPQTPKCPFMAMPVQTSDGKVAVMGADGFCPVCLFYSQLLNKCEIRMLLDKMLYNK